MTINQALAARLGISVNQVRTLKRKIDDAASAQEREHNEPNAPSSDDATGKVENYAKKLGYGCIWPGLYPVLTKDGQQFHLS